MNEEVKSILGNEIIVDKVKIPVGHLKYKGNKKNFITWKLLDETPELCANDDDLCSVCPLDIDIYSDKNYLNVLKKIKKMMKENDWVWSGDSQEMLDDDTGLYHKTCSFEKERMIENG